MALAWSMVLNSLLVTSMVIVPVSAWPPSTAKVTLGIVAGVPESHTVPVPQMAWRAFCDRGIDIGTTKGADHDLSFADVDDGGLLGLAWVGVERLVGKAKAWAVRRLRRRTGVNVMTVDSIAESAFEDRMRF